MAAFLFDRGVYRWGTHVEQEMDEAEYNIRQRMRNAKGVEGFIASHRQLAYNKLMGITDTTNVYKQPQIVKKKEEAKEISGEGEFDLKSFN